MSDGKTPQPSEAAQQQRAKAQRLASAFVSVFGKGSGRTEEQRLVRAYLEANADWGRNCFQFGQYKDGIEGANAAAQRDGAQSLIRVIDKQISLASKLKESAKSKPAVKR